VLDSSISTTPGVQIFYPSETIVVIRHPSAYQACIHGSTTQAYMLSKKSGYSCLPVYTNDIKKNAVLIFWPDSFTG
jgi:hypothetical protein